MSRVFLTTLRSYLTTILVMAPVLAFGLLMDRLFNPWIAVPMIVASFGIWFAAWAAWEAR